jgi:hypothetical protein
MANTVLLQLFEALAARLEELAGLIGPRSEKVKKNPLATAPHTITSSMAFIV